jgi:hypothetical protein
MLAILVFLQKHESHTTCKEATANTALMEPVYLGYALIVESQLFITAASSIHKEPPNELKYSVSLVFFTMMFFLHLA